MKLLKTYIIKAISGLIPGIMPPLHIYIFLKLWGKYSRRVDKRYCSCSCWDTVFKGTYESGIASYKHMYFNATSNTLKIWSITVACIIVLYECLKYELKLLFENRLRPLMAILFISSMFSHYYTWWVYVNYWNDDFYLQWNHQLFFTLTEILSTSLVLHLSNSKVIISSRKVLFIIAIATIHILSGSLDQFVKNVLWGEGYAHQVIRDIAFVVPDILHVIFPTIELLKIRKENSQLSLKNDLIYMFGFILFGLLVFRPNGTCIREIRPVPSDSEVQYLNYQINSKSNKLKISIEKLTEIKKTISKIIVKKNQIQYDYNRLLKKLKDKLNKTQLECKYLNSEIGDLNEKRLKIKTEMEKVLQETSQPEVKRQPLELFINLI